nr:hypothetical protein CFP56_09525 [Quercus suber]
MFRDETTSTASKVRRRVRAKQRERERESIVDASTAISPGPPNKKLLSSIQETAINRFFHDFVLDSRSIMHKTSTAKDGYFALISEMYHGCKPRSSFALALSAAANANFWRRHKSFEARSNSLKDYSKALQQLQKDLKCNGQSNVTAADMLAASTLLATYDTITSRDVSQRASWSAHVYGAVALLESSEGRDDRAKHELAGVLQQVVFQMLVDSLIMARHPSLSLERCTSVMATAPPQTPLVRFMFKTAELFAIWKDSVDENIGNNTTHRQNLDISEFLETCQSLDAEMESWMHSRPQEEVGTVLIRQNIEENIPIPLRALFATPGAPATLRLCADINQTHRWHFYRACQLTLLRTMMAATTTALAPTAATITDVSLIEYYKQIEAEIHSRTSKLVDDLLSTCFSTLTVKVPGKGKPETVADVQSFRGWQLLWPLHTAGTCLISLGRHCPDGMEKLEWVRTLYRYIRDDLGIQSANKFLQSRVNVNMPPLKIPY